MEPRRRDFCPLLHSPLNYFQKQQDEHNRQNEAETATTVIAPPGAGAVSSIAKSENQHKQNDDQEHCYLPRRRITTFPVMTGMMSYPSCLRDTISRKFLDRRLDADVRP